MMVRVTDENEKRARATVVDVMSEVQIPLVCRHSRWVKSNGALGARVRHNKWKGEICELWFP